MTAVPTATETARAVVLALLRAGVTDVVLSPGSRNAPLSFASLDAARAGRLRLHTRIDERSAGFLAVGLTRGGARAAVMCTSGTAVTNLHPAVLEAAHAGLPLMVVTADRPARWRGTNANQTTDQVGIFGPLVTTYGVAAPVELPSSNGNADGPTHWNVRFEDPLTPESPWEVPSIPAPDVLRGERGLEARFPRISTTDPLPTGPRTVVVAGDDAGPPARQLAEAARWPLFAEPTSGARTGTHALRCYRLLLDTDLARSIERVVVVGHPTLSRPVTRLLGRADVEVLVVPAAGVWNAPHHPARVLDGIPRAPEQSGSDAWLTRWREADREVSTRLDRLLREEPYLTPHEVVGAVSRAVPPGGLLTVGASNPIRDLDVMAGPYPVGERRLVIANRGLSGIDGTVSTAIGAALGRAARHQEHGRNLALMGDVTFLHDSNGLLLGPQEERPDLTIVVVNDDGGSIFSVLEQGAPAYADSFERLFASPHGADLASLCATSRTPHWRATSLPQLEQALANPNGGIEVVEAVVGRAERRDLDSRIRALAPLP